MSGNKNLINHSRIEVKEGNVHIGDNIIARDDPFFHYKILRAVEICLVDRKIQDKSLIDRKYVVRYSAKNLVGILFGTSDELPEIYRNRLEYHLNDWFEVKTSIGVKPKLISIDWPDSLQSNAELREAVYYDLRNYCEGSIEDRDPFDSIYSKYSNQHIVFYDIISIGEEKTIPKNVLSEKDLLIDIPYQNLINGFFEFWEQIPPRFDSHQTIALLVLKYPAKLADGERVSRLINFLEGVYLRTHMDMPEKKDLSAGKFKIAECFVFPKVENIRMKDIDNWLHYDCVDQVIGHLNLSFYFQDWFEQNNERQISLKKFNDLLVGFIKNMLT